MKTTLLTAVLALSPGFAFSTFAQEKKPDAPREEHKEHADREHHEAAEAQAREEIEKHTKAAMDQAAKLEAEGKTDEASVLRHKVKEQIASAMAERAAHAGRGDGDAKRPDGPPRAELEGKLKHLEQAIAHLREAGLPEPAEHLSQTANRMRAALRGEGEPRREEAKREEPRREDGNREEAKREEPKREAGRREEPKREDGRREDAKREEPRRDDRRPDNDVEALRREIQELRQAVRQLNEQPKR